MSAWELGRTRLVGTTVLLGMSLLGGSGTLAEVAGVGFSDAASLIWDPSTGVNRYYVYRGEIDGLAQGNPARCHGFRVSGTLFDTPAQPATGAGYFYLLTERRLLGETSPGDDSFGNLRPLMGNCEPVMRDHVFDRLGFGWSEWTRDRYESTTLNAYIAEQLDPTSIDESTNTDLSSRLAGIDPPLDIFHLLQQQIVRAVYARRQLEQQVATFWANHFNTDWSKVANLFQGVYPECDDMMLPEGCDPGYPAQAYQVASDMQYREIEAFRAQGFGGTFRQMLESSALSPGMIVYLDTYLSIAAAPNENYPRELMELHTLGVNGGYTQQDVEELSRVITGWSACLKIPPNTQPLDLCDNGPGSIWYATFIIGAHDCTEKVLFAGTPQELTIPDTCAAPFTGVNDLGLALDALATHPSTAQYISRKLLQRFVTDTPDQELVDQIAAVYSDAGNPLGVGDMKAVLEAIFSADVLRNPDYARSKIKTPLEHLASSMRATRGFTDGFTGSLDFLALTQHLPHFNPVPTGWPENGESWIGTNNTLDRQNFGFNLMFIVNPVFGSDPLTLLNDNGVSTLPGNTEAIVDFFSDAFFGGALTPAERQTAIDNLDQDAGGVPGPYDDNRILETIALMLGYPQFQEQ